MVSGRGHDRSRGWSVGGGHLGRDGHSSPISQASLTVKVPGATGHHTAAPGDTAAVTAQPRQQFRQDI